jgi:hypothetical protein
VSAAFRALIAALLVALVAFGGALYIGYRNGLSAGQTSYDMGTGKIASIDLSGLLGPQVIDQQLIGLAFRQVEHVYYRPVDSSTLVDGEHSGLVDFLKDSFKVKRVSVDPELPVAQTSDGDQSADLHTLDSQLAYAQDHYAQYLGKDGRSELTQAAVR